MGSPRIRVLASAFATVPGVTAHSAAMMSLVTGVRCELDLVTVKTHDLPHVKRIGEARMFRVPVGNGTHAERRSAFTRAVHRQIEAESYASIHALDAWSGAAAAALKDELGLRMTYEMVAAPEDGPSEEWDEAHERALAAAETLIVPTQAAAARMSESGFAGTVTVVPPGVDVDRFDFVERPPLMIPRVLYIGTFTAERDLDTVLAAIQRVASYRPLRALFAGEPLAARRQRLRARVSELGLVDKVEVRGALPARSLPHLIGAADICICPSDGQGITLPQPLVEYLACCRAVIAANCLGLSEVVKDEQQALLEKIGMDESEAPSGS